MSLTDRIYPLLAGRLEARPLGFVRIVIGAAAVVRALEGARILWPLTQPKTLRLPHATWLPEPSEAWVGLLIAVWALSALAFAVGWKTRWAGATLAVAIGLALLSDQQAYSNHLYLMFLLVCLMTVGDAGAALSVDSRVRPRATVPAGPVLLMKLQVSIVYGFAALTKLNDGFLSGHVVSAQIGRGVLPVPDLVRTQLVAMAVAVAVVLLEAFLAFGLWSQRYRPLALVAGFGFHVAIVLLMAPLVQLAVFAVEMLAVYLLFLDLGPASRVVDYDHRCGYCTVTADRLVRLDWLGTLASSRGASEGSLGPTLKDGDGSWGGLRAVGRALEAMPATYLVAPAHRVLGRLGERAYRRFARGRGCRVAVAEARAGSAGRGRPPS